MLMLCISLPCFSQSVEHVVDKGETFASIAQKYGMTEQQLKEANPKYRGVFYVGMTLNIPQKYANASSATPQAQPSPEPQQETTAPKQTEAPKPKNYEGDTDKEGRPDGYGTMYFESVYDGEAFTEKLEGTWKKGAPVKGKSFRYYKDSGKLRMKFEGEFKMKEKGVLRNLMDLKAVGEIAFYYYENNMYFDDRGYYVKYGSYDGKQITKGYCVSSKKKAMTPLKNGDIGYWSTNLNPDARKYLDELLPSVGSAWILDRKPSFNSGYVSNKEDRFIKVNDVSWSGSLNNGLLDGQGEGFFTLRSDRETVNYNVKGEFKNGVPVKVTIRRELHANDGNAYTRAKDQTSLILTMGELQNNQRSVTVESLTHQNDKYDVSYSGYVDSNFKLLENYAAAEKQKVLDKENQAWGALFGAIGAAVGGTINVLNKLAPDTPSKSYNTGSVEIDWDRCKEPSSDLEGDGNIFRALFDSNEWESAEPGVIAFKNSYNKYKYIIIYNPDKSFKCYEVKGPYAKGFYDTKEQMMKAIIEAEQRYK